MDSNIFLKPTKRIGIIFGLITSILVINILSIRLLDFGSYLLAFLTTQVQFNLWLVLGLPVNSSDFPSFIEPNGLYYFLTITFNIIIIYLISAGLSYFYDKRKIKNSK